MAAILATLGLSALVAVPAPQAVRAASLFQTAELNPANFAVVAAPIGNGERAQLNIYEQLNDRRACFAVNGSQPAVVEPLLATFDFTGICSRYLDANGYSLRIGDTDLAPGYRLSVVRFNDDNLLLAVPTRSGIGPEMVVARTNGPGTDYLKLVLEPGWQLKRRAYNGRNLGHVYLYRANWPGDEPAAMELKLEAEAPPLGAAEGPVPLEVRLGSDELINDPGFRGF
ncbi:MAG: DUF3747 domain-containing protein [Cyanobium sp. PLM2.Bin73]|nr:MAG: DUF3747 domain-containing protein [Cyanobium sp. PLM2.Bin73]